MFEHRPYVIALVLIFLLVAPAERGFLRAGIWLVSGTFIGWAFEVSSIRTGFPFGSYVYHQEMFADELWILGVPMFASLSFAALTYFGHSLAYTLLSPIKRGGKGIERIENIPLANSFKVLLLASIIITWLDMVMDPITHLGDYWWLGQIYHYDPEGIHFGVPLTNYMGWLLTSFTIVFVNQFSDHQLWKCSYQFKGAYTLPNLALWGLFCNTGNYIFMLVILYTLFNNPNVPTDTPLTGILISTLIFSGIFFLFNFVMLLRGLRLGNGMVLSEAHPS